MFGGSSPCGPFGILPLHYNGLVSAFVQDLDTKSQSKIKNLTVRHGQRGQRGFVDDDILLIVIPSGELT